MNGANGARVEGVASDRATGMRNVIPVGLAVDAKMPMTSVSTRTATRMIRDQDLDREIAAAEEAIVTHETPPPNAAVAEKACPLGWKPSKSSLTPTWPDAAAEAVRVPADEPAEAVPQAHGLATVMVAVLATVMVAVLVTVMAAVLVTVMAVARGAVMVAARGAVRARKAAIALTIHRVAKVAVTMIMADAPGAAVDAAIRNPPARFVTESTRRSSPPASASLGENMPPSEIGSIRILVRSSGATTCHRCGAS